MEVFCELGTHTSQDNNMWHSSFDCRDLSPLVHFVEARLLFSGRPPLGFGDLVFLLPGVISRVLFWRRVSFGHLPGRFYRFLDRILWCLGRVFRAWGSPPVLLVCIADPQGHTFVAVAPPDHQLAVK